jgi:hypothetical protein
MSDKNEKLVYITADGKEIPYKRLSFVKRDLAIEGLKQEWIERGEPILPPTYKVPVLGDDYVELELDETNLVTDDPQETAKRQALWRKHKDALARFEKAKKDYETHFLCSAILLDLPEDDSWIAAQEAEHIRVPKHDRSALRDHWIQTELFTVAEDIADFATHVYAMSAMKEVTPETLASASNSFRRALLSRDRQDNTPPGTEANQGQGVVDT